MNETDRSTKRFNAHLEMSQIAAVKAHRERLLQRNPGTKPSEQDAIRSLIEAGAAFWEAADETQVINPQWLIRFAVEKYNETRGRKK